jgi:hypothetical protein
MSELKALLTEENANKIAEDIISALETEGTKETLDVDYEISQGVMKRKIIQNQEIRNTIKSLHGEDLPAPNTSFSFNAKKGTALWYINTTLCKLIENNEISDEDYSCLNPFLVKIIKKLNSNNFKEKIRVILRNSVLGGAEEFLFPIKDLNVMLFEFGDKADYGDIIKVNKMSRYIKISGNFVGEKKAISYDLFNRRRAFGYGSSLSAKEIYDTIVREQKAAKNPIYDDVLPEDVIIVKEAKECHLDIFADYSVISREEFETKKLEFLAANKAND